MIAIGFLAGCGDSSGPSSKVTASVSDATGDTFGSGLQWDATGLTVTRDTGGVDVALDFTATTLSAAGGTVYPTTAIVEFDTDQDSTTGDPALVDFFRPNIGSTGMGVEFAITVDSLVNVVDVVHSASAGTVPPVFSGKRVSFRIPRAMLGGDDGFLNAAATVGNDTFPTDIVPNNGHLKVGGIGPVAPYMPTASMRRPNVQPVIPLPWKRTQ
jgi:hypothetical protein